MNIRSGSRLPGRPPVGLPEGGMKEVLITARRAAITMRGFSGLAGAGGGAEVGMFGAGLTWWQGHRAYLVAVAACPGPAFTGGGSLLGLTVTVTGADHSAVRVLVGSVPQVSVAVTVRVNS